MKKSIFCFLIFILIGALMLSGCGTQDPSPETDPENPTPGISTEPAPTEAVPVDEDVFYFVNELEYNRLYSMRQDGSDLKLAVDQYCYDAKRVENQVFFLSDGDFWVYDISSGTYQVYIPGVLSYALDGNDLVYFRELDAAFDYEMRYRNLKTGEDLVLESPMTGGDWKISNRKLYYSVYDVQESTTQLCVYDFTTMEKRILADANDGYSYFYQLLPSNDGVFFQSSDQNYETGFYFASADGSGIYQIDAGMTFDCSTFYQVEGAYYCVSSVYDETKGAISSIHRHNTDGTVMQILESNDSGYFGLEALNEDMWLIDQITYSGWGDQNEYGNFENFVSLRNHFLMDREGNVTPLDITGELGKLFAAGDFPVMDSSTARKPVTAGIYNLFVANYGYEGAEPICSTTHGAWLKIADREADIALLAAPTEEELAYLKEKNVEIEMKLYGGDGLVFIGNSANPVTNLTHDQIIGIYRGEITNWSELGGPDHPITVYYRDDQSGSQRLFEKLVFKGLEIPVFYELGFDIMDEMSTIVDIVMSDPYSIGYSIMTYLDDVYDNEELKVFAVNGVVPSVDSIKDSSYPYHTQGYVVIRADEPEDSPARRLFNWFGSAVCNDLLNQCSVTPLDDSVG